MQYTQHRKVDTPKKPKMGAIPRDLNHWRDNINEKWNAYKISAIKMHRRGWRLCERYQECPPGTRTNYAHWGGQRQQI